VPTKTVYDAIIELERVIHKQPTTVTDKDIVAVKKLINRIIKESGCVLVVYNADDHEHTIIGVFQSNEDVEEAVKEYKSKSGSHGYFWKAFHKIGENWGTKDPIEWMLI